MRIAELSVRRPVFATVLSMMLVIFGLVSLQRLSVREYPDIDRPVVSITTAYRGASSAVIETKVTQIIEDSVAGIEGILKIESDSEDERSQVRIEFDISRDIDAAAMQLSGSRADSGAWLQRLDNVESRVANQKLLAQTEQSNAEDLDMVHAISDFQLKQTGYSAALQAYSTVQRLSLFDYLR